MMIFLSLTPSRMLIRIIIWERVVTYPPIYSLVYISMDSEIFILFDYNLMQSLFILSLKLVHLWQLATFQAGSHALLMVSSFFLTSLLSDAPGSFSVPLPQP